MHDRMTRLQLLAGLLFAFGCHEGTRAPESPPAPSSGESPPAPQRMKTVDEHMHEQFVALKDVQKALIMGDLAAARRHGETLQNLTAEGDPGPWEERMSFVRERAGRLVAAETPAAARRLTAELATYCADCHMVDADESLFVPDAQPPDDGTLAARMARHQWGADAMWLGLIAPSSDPWRDGLAVMAAVPAAPAEISSDPTRHADFERLGRRLADLASRAGPLPGQGDRAEAFADIIDVCAACHAISRPRPR